MKTSTFLRATLLAVALIIQSVTLLLADNLTPKEQKGKWGYVNAGGAWVIKPKYEKAEPFNHSYAAVSKKGKWGLIDATGKEVFGCKYSPFTFLSEGTIFAKEASSPAKGILINPAKGVEYKMTDIKETKIGEQYFALTYTVGFSWKVSAEDMYKQKGFLASRDGKMVYDGVSAVQSHGNNILAITAADKETKFYAMLLKDELKILGDRFRTMDNYTRYSFTSSQFGENSYGYLIDNEGNIFTATDHGSVFRNARGKAGLFVEGQFVLPTQYDDIIEQRDNQNLLYVCKNQHWGIYNVEKKKFIVPCQYSSEKGENPVPFIYINKLHAYFAHNDGKYGLLDEEGKQILPVEYDGFEADRYGGYLLVVYKGGFQGLYDVENKKFRINPDKYEELGEWNFKGIHAKIGDKHGVVDVNGKLIVPVRYKTVRNSIGYGSDNRIWPAVTADGKIDYYNNKGKLIIPAGKYSSEINEGNCVAKVIVVRKGKKVGAVTYDGVQVAPCIYDEYICSGMEGRLLFCNNTNTGGKAFVLSAKGAVLKTATFLRSQQYAMANFIKNWLGYVID